MFEYACMIRDNIRLVRRRWQRRCVATWTRWRCIIISRDRGMFTESVPLE